MVQFTQRVVSALMTGAVLTAAAGCAPKHLDSTKGYPTIQPSADVETRVNKLVAQMTPAEKIHMLGGTGFTTQPIPRLGIPAFVMSDGPVGARNAGETTAYPAGIALAATFDKANALAIGEALGRDCRSRGVHILLAPAMNIFRSPLTGRNFEYLGEDPLLAGELAAGYVNGLQSERVSATIKHFAGNEQEFDRHHLDTIVDERTLREIYLKPFEICLEQSHPWALMTSYNPLNGVHASQDRWLMTDVLKDQWAFPGMVMSDWDSCYDTLGMANGGLDLEMPRALFFTPAKLQPLIDSGQVSMATIDDKVRRILRVGIAMGWFDQKQKDASIPADDPKNNLVALNGARESVTLLKNDGHILPLDAKKLKNIVLIGPCADPAVVSGGGSGATKAFHPVSIFEGVKALAGADATVTRIPWTPPGLGKEMTHQVPSSGTWKAEFFTNDNLKGEPALTREDKFIDFDWPRHEPAKGIPHDHFSARWTGTIKVDHTGPFVVACKNDDGARVYVDGKLVIDDWSNHATVENNVTLNLEAGRDIPVVVEYFNAVLGAEVHFGWAAPRELLPAKYYDVIKNADVVIACLGYNDKTGATVQYEGEGSDRPFALPANQLEVLNKTLSLNPRTVVNLFAGGAVDTEGWLNKTPAFLMSYYLGSNEGTAVAETLFGKNNPSGRLPFTWEKKWEDYPAYGNYPTKEAGRVNDYKEGVFVGYRRPGLQEKPPLFAFGSGLSYTNFAMSAPLTKVVGDTVEVTVKVANTGYRKGTEVVQFYVTPPSVEGVKQPTIELKAFERVTLDRLQTKTVICSFPTKSLAYWAGEGKDGHWVIAPGGYTVYAAKSSVDLGVGTSVNIGG